MNKVGKFACVAVATVAAAYFLHNSLATVIIAVFGFWAAAGE